MSCPKNENRQVTFLPNQHALWQETSRPGRGGRPDITVATGEVAGATWKALRDKTNRSGGLSNIQLIFLVIFAGLIFVELIFTYYEYIYIYIFFNLPKVFMVCESRQLKSGLTPFAAKTVASR